MSRGIDVSHHNGVIDWKAVKASGIEFAIIRAGYGQTNDRNFKANIEGAQAAGLPVGVYYFSYATNILKAAEEGTHCCELLAKYKIDLPVFYDFEYETELYGARYGVTYTKELRTAIIKAFCERVRAGGYTPGIYTNVDYIVSRLYWGELSAYPLWLAQWPLGTGKSITFESVREDSVNTKYGKPSFWQFGFGKVPGIPTDTDLNFGYIPLPKRQNDALADDIKPGDKVRVVNTTTSGNLKRAKLYGSDKTFVVYYDTYDVIERKGDRVVIGIGKAVTAAVDIRDLRKI